MLHTIRPPNNSNMKIIQFFCATSVNQSSPRQKKPFQEPQKIPSTPTDPLRKQLNTKNTQLHNKPSTWTTVKLNNLPLDRNIDHGLRGLSSVVVYRIRGLTGFRGGRHGLLGKCRPMSELHWLFWYSLAYWFPISP